MALVLGVACWNGRSISLGFGGAPVDWVLASFAGSFLIAVNTVFAKRILMVHVPGVSGYLGLVGVIVVMSYCESLMFQTLRARSGSRKPPVEDEPLALYKSNVYLPVRPRDSLLVNTRSR